MLSALSQEQAYHKLAPSLWIMRKSNVAFIVALPVELFRLIAEYLHPSEILKCIMSCKIMFSSSYEDYYMWTLVCSIDNMERLQYLKRKHRVDEVGNIALLDVARDIEGLRRMDIMHWRSSIINESYGLMPAQEAHAACVLDNTFGVIVGGWENNGDVDVTNDIVIFDGSHLPQVWKVPCHSMISTNARFVYGFSVVKIDERRLLRYGGLREGGYSAAVRGEWSHIALRSFVIIFVIMCRYCID